MTGKRTVILADGDFPQSRKVLDVLDQAAFVICCDGAAKKLLHYGRMPDLVVGDLDSLEPELREKFRDRIVHFHEQESNDLSKAFRCCLERGCSQLVILGATGKREDHTLGNLSLLADYSDQLSDISLMSDYGTFLVARGKCTVPAVPGQQISLIAVDRDTRVTSSGLKYPLCDLELAMWWQGTLNEALGNRFSLDISPGSRLLVFLESGSGR